MFCCVPVPEKDLDEFVQFETRETKFFRINQLSDFYDVEISTSNQIHKMTDTKPETRQVLLTANKADAPRFGASAGTSAPSQNAASAETARFGVDPPTTC